ncbi:MAG TPA: hypothetical protein VJW94_09325 [Candidatus Acidoferrum sp.]|nr:hypothetical protein [Candidatus Acidoferrum sp.]
MRGTIPLDHVATWNEVCEALAFSSLDAYGRGPVSDICCEVSPDLQGGVRVAAEELAWMALAKGAMDSSCN